MKSKEQKIEPLLAPQKNRYVIFPIKHHNIYGKCIKRQLVHFGRQKR